MIFWWTGRGYLALLTLVGGFGLFGLLMTTMLGSDAMEQHSWLWSIGAVIAAVATWVVGRRVNRRPLKPPPLRQIKSLFTYRPPNRFMSLPIETWAIPALALAVILAIQGLRPPI